MSTSPEPLRRPQEASSQSTDDASTHLTPSSESDDDDGLTMVGDSYTGQSFRMKSLSSASKERVRKGNTAEGPKKYDGEYEEGEDENTQFLEESRRLSHSSSVQSFELYTPDEDRSVLKKLDRKLVLFMALLYLLSFLDRSSKWFLSLYVRGFCFITTMVGIESSMVDRLTGA
jgi:phosphatidylinositol 3,5-bisphosphate 5-phosphatase